MQQQELHCFSKRKIELRVRRLCGEVWDHCHALTEGTEGMGKRVIGLITGAVGWTKGDLLQPFPRSPFRQLLAAATFSLFYRTCVKLIRKITPCKLRACSRKNLYHLCRVVWVNPFRRCLSCKSTCSTQRKNIGPVWHVWVKWLRRLPVPQTTHSSKHFTIFAGWNDLIMTLHIHTFRQHPSHFLRCRLVCCFGPKLLGATAVELDYFFGWRG